MEILLLYKKLLILRVSSVCLVVFLLHLVFTVIVSLMPDEWILLLRGDNKEIKPWLMTGETVLFFVPRVIFSCIQSCEL
jgi:Na+-driven multidrug efflux pump